VKDAMPEHAATAPPKGEQKQRGPRAILKALGPGLVAGASDNDPTTVASLSVIGATTIYRLSWLVILVIPMLVIVQVVSATVGVVARGGLEDVVRHRYGKVWAFLVLLLVLAVSLITLAADLEGGSAALSLLTGLSYRWFIAPFALGVALLLIRGDYHSLERVLKYVLVIFLAYIITAFVARPHWGAVLRDTFVPHLSLSSDYVTGALALLGTTLTSYAYVWETIEEAEERPPIRRLGLVQVDAAAGMVAAGVIFWFIVIGTGATLGVHHQQVQTAQDAANALAPLAGRFASIIFGVGLLASALLALPVLAATSAYVMAEAFGWRASLDSHFGQARAFYGALIASLVIGGGITLLGVGPIQLLFASSIAGGIATPVTLAILMVTARDAHVMKEHRIGRSLMWGGWLVTAVVSIAVVVFLWQTLTGGG
jgi:Mn2+/Fe2+ NRAMP family transporter